MTNNTDFFSVKIPFNNENPLELKDLKTYFANVEQFFLANGVELEIYDAQTGSFIPNFRQVQKVGGTLLTISAILSNCQPILDKIDSNQPLSAQEIKTIQPIIAVNSKVVVQNVNYGGKTYDTGKFDVEKLAFDNNNGEELVAQETPSEPQKYESQELVFTKIDTKDNNQCAGKILELDDKIKKVVFSSPEVKATFNFSESDKPFEHTYIVDVNVYYNKNGSIAKYEVLGLVSPK